MFSENQVKYTKISKIFVNYHLTVIKKFKTEVLIKPDCTFIFCADFKAQPFDFA